MKKSNLGVVIVLLILASVVGSCKIEFISPTFKPTSGATISKLPESEKSGPPTAAERLTDISVQK